MRMLRTRVVGAALGILLLDGDGGETWTFAKPVGRIDGDCDEIAVLAIDTASPVTALPPYGARLLRRAATDWNRRP